jgi:hypothetical protein
METHWRGLAEEARSGMSIIDYFRKYSVYNGPFALRATKAYIYNS